MRTAALAAWFVLAASGAAGAPPHAALVACNDDDCSTSPDAIERATYVWLWSAEAVPVRVTPTEAKAILGRGLAPHAERASIRIERRDDTPLQLIAAPAAMWREVPERLLPRHDVPKNGVLLIPRRAGERWIGRVVGEGEGSWWTPLENGVTTIAPLAARTASLRIVGADGTPLATAALTVAVARSGASREVVAQHRADDRGMVVIEALPDRDPLTLVISDKGHAPQSLTERVSQLPSTVTLRRGADIMARFVDSDGKAVPGVRVRAEAWLAGSGAVISRESVSGADGRWRIAALPAGSRVVVVANANGFGTVRREVEVGSSADLGTIGLEKGETLRVRVVEQGGRGAVAGAKVRIAPEREVTTDDKGVAQLADVSSSAPIEVSAKADGFLPVAVRLAAPFDPLTEIEMTRAFTVTGHFTDAAGQPIAGATARVLAGNSSREVALDGAAFRIALQPDQPATIELVSPTTRAARIDVEGAPGETRDLGTIQPHRGAAVRGRIIAADGTPVAGASIWTPRAVAAGAVAAWARVDVIRAQSDAEGEFALRGAGPEPALVRFDAPGFARAFRSVTFDENGMDVDLGNIVMAAGATVRVLGRADAPEAVVRVVSRPESGDVDTLVAAMRGGVATVRHVPPGRAVVAVVRQRSTVCEKAVDISESGEVIEVDCTAGGVRVRGSVLLGQRPAEGGTLVWSSPHAAPVAGVIINNVSRLGAVQQQPFGVGSEVMIEVGGDGRFESDELRAGAWLVRWMSPSGATTEPRQVVVAERPEVAVVIRYDEAVVRGIVVDERAQPVRQAAVRQLNGNGFAVTRADGTFVIAGLAPGAYRFRAEARGMRSEGAEVTIEAGRTPEPLRLVLRPDAGDALALRVQSSRGGPAAGALVFVETSAGETRIVTTNQDGRALVSFPDGVPPSLRAAAIPFGDWRGAASVENGLTLTMGEAGGLAVVSDDHGAVVGIRAPNGWDVRMLMMRIGSVPLVGDAPLQIAGLPPGTYDVSVGTAVARATVRRGETTTVTLRR